VVIVWDSSSDLTHPPDCPPGTFLLALTDQAEIAAFPQSVAGLFYKEESPEALAAAIRQVARGQHYLSSQLALSLVRNAGQPTSINLENLSDREREILNLLSQGLSNKSIAARLYLSVRTVEGHLDRLYTRLGVHSRTEAVILTIQHFQDR
jgi:DNA-binding NarL/FixJ family response regulator